MKPLKQTYNHARLAATAALLLALLAGCGTTPTPRTNVTPGTPAVSIASPGQAAPPGATAPGKANAAAAGCLQQAPGAPKDAREVKVSRVVDGDTVQLEDKSKVRLIGINTPESVDPNRPVQAYGKESSAFAKQLLEGKTVRMQLGRTPKDKYDRLLAWFWLPDGRFVNAYLVQQGYAQVYTFSDNPDHADLLLACQREARDANNGLWRLPEYKEGGQAAKMDRQGSGTSTASPGTAAASVTITKAPGTVRGGDTAKLTAKTTPGATCTITVSYKSGASKAPGLTPKTADSSGAVAWSWDVSTNTTAGTWPVDVSCGGQTAHSSVTVR